MPLIKPRPQPGIVSQATQVQAQNAWFRGNRVRWRYGYLEKMGGWQRLAADPFKALIRRMHAWLDLQNMKNLLVGTDFGLELLVQATRYVMGSIYPLKGGYVPATGVPGSTTFQTTTGSPTVQVNIPFTPVPGEDTFQFLLPVSLGGRIIAVGTIFTVKARVSGGFTFDMPLNALTTESTFGIRLFENNSVNGMTCTWKNHGLIAGQTFNISQTTTLRLGAPGVWEMVSFSAPIGWPGTVSAVIDADHFTFAMATAGLGDGVGGTNHQVMEGSELLYGTDGSVVTSLGTVLGIVQPIFPGDAQVNTWFLDNQGQNGLALSTGGPLWVYKPPTSNAPAMNIVGAGSAPTAPQHSNGMFVTMPQAQVILFGSEVGAGNPSGGTTFGQGIIDPLLVRFSDVGTYDVWSGTVSNQAGSYRLGRGSKIVGGIQAPQTTLLITDVDLWAMSYIGPPLIYGFTIMGTGCGLIAPHAIVTLGKTTFWLSQKNVWSFGDAGVQQVPCSVWDFIFENLDTINVNKCQGAANSATAEVAFFFPPKDAVFPVGKNALASSQDFTGAVWTKTAATPTVTASVVAPDLSNTTTLLTELNINGVHEVSQTIQKFGEQQTFTLSVYAHKNSTRNICLRCDARDVTGAVVIFNPTTGAHVYDAALGPFEINNFSAVTDDFATGIGANGWLRYTLTFTTDDSGNLDLGVALANGNQRSYLGANQFDYIWGAQLDIGGQALEYNATGAVIAKNEPTRYIKFNVMEKAWDSGTLTRTSWLDQSIWGTPLGADENLLVQQHERGFDADGQPMTDVFIESGFTEISDGSAMMSISQCHPDFKWFGNNGEVQIRLKGKNYPEDGPAKVYGPFSVTPTTRFFDPRLRARYVAIRYDWSPVLGFSARVGAVTYRVKQTGRRP
jgi:hypothetical protein